MFFIVNKVDGAETWEYHYSLVTGILKSNVLLSIVFFSWFLYARKCYGYVTHRLRKPEYGSLKIMSSLPRLKQLGLFFATETWLLLPVLLYALLMIGIGFAKHFYLQSLSVILFLFSLLLGASIGHWRELNNYTAKKISGWKSSRLKLSGTYFPFIVMQYIFRYYKFTWLGIKLFTCGILYLVARNNSLTERDIKTVFLFYSFGIMTNAIIIYQARKFEELTISFYRSMPVPLFKRFLQYAFILFILVVPEFVTGYILVPAHLRYYDAASFPLSGFGLFLLLNSVSFMQSFSVKEFLKITMVIFCLQYIFIMTAGFIVLYVLLISAALWLFLANYWKYERSTDV